MAFSRKTLKAMGLTEEQVDSLIDMHTDTIEALKRERDGYKADAERLPEVQRALDDANAKLEAAETDGFKAKYEKEHSDFEAYRAEVTSREANAAKTEAYRTLLRETGLRGDKLIETILGTADLSKIELENGRIKDADGIAANIRTEWADYIGKITETGAKVETPPKAGGSVDLGSLSMEDYIAARRKS